MNLAIEHIEQTIKLTEREQSDALRCAEECRKQLTDADSRVSTATAKLSDLRAALPVLRAAQNVTAIPEVPKRLEKRRA